MDLKFGDRVLVAGSKEVGIVRTLYSDSAFMLFKDGVVRVERIKFITRLARVLEEIEEFDGNNFNLKHTYRRTFLEYIENEIYPIRVLGEVALYTNFKYFRLIPKEITKAEKLLEIVKAIENNDERILSEMAEIILSAREKTKES